LMSINLYTSSRLFFTLLDIQCCLLSDFDFIGLIS
jgi:hypothetical protein